MSRTALRKMAGIAVVEFAIVGLLTFVLLFASIEFGRLIFTWNTLTEGTRRGARMAAVCPREAGTSPLNSPVANATIFKSQDGLSSIISFQDLTTGNVKIEYLKADGTDADSGTTDAIYAQIAFVRVSIIGYVFRSAVPFAFPDISMPAFSTTLPAESLGIVPGSATRSCADS